MKKIVMFITAALLIMAMATGVFAGCGCGGGKLKADPIHDGQSRP